MKTERPFQFAPMPSRCVRLTMKGFTLIEMLAVIALISLAAAALIPNLVAAGRSADMLRVIARVREIDSRARTYARTSGHVILVWIDSENRSILMVESDTGMTLGEVEIEPNISLSIEVDGHGAKIVFDRLGHSADYRVELRGNGSAARLSVAGLTGFFQSTGALS